MHRLICLGALALLLSPLVAWSQDPPTIVPGSRIRITELEGRKSTGFVVTTGADTVVLRLEGGGDTVPFPWHGKVYHDSR